MRLPTLVAALAIAAGCSSSVTDPFRATMTPAPSGLPVSSKITWDTLPNGPSIVAAGDSVVVAAPLSGSGCGNVQSASAGVSGGVLVITSVSTWPDEPVACALIARATGPTFRAVVRPAPSGRYAVAVRERIQQQQGSASFNEREITRQTVTVR